MPSVSCSSVGVEKLMRKDWQGSLSSVRKAVPGTTHTLCSVAFLTNSSISTPAGRVHQANRPPSKWLQVMPRGLKYRSMASSRMELFRR